MTAAWDADKVAIFKSEFFRFLEHVRINSKELGNICLAEHVYTAQHRFLDQIFDGLSRDIHWFDILKSRQLGITTVARALSVFWLGVHDGLKGYSILDTDPHKEEGRIEIVQILESLPARFSFPRIKRQNRYMIELANGSLLNLASGGVKASKGSGALGRSSGVNFAHVSEMCSIDNPEGIESFKNSLAENFPNRLYLWESTARGYNQRHEMWEETKADENHKCAVFIGWWAKDNQRIEQDDPDFVVYGEQLPTDRELTLMVQVKKQYGWTITPEQLAWIRRRMDPAAKAEGDGIIEYEGDSLRVQEQPWTEEEAYQQTGSTFFHPTDLKTQTDKWVSHKYKAYEFLVESAQEFDQIKIIAATVRKMMQLKVWEEPVDDATYIIGADPAFGGNEHNDRGAIQVTRAYADGLDQVAEYAWPLITAEKFAWVILALAGWYAGTNGRNEVYIQVEVNGPGNATWANMKRVREQILMGWRATQMQERGLTDFLSNVKNYIFTRNDSMGGGGAWHWKTSPDSKVYIMERLRDITANGMLRIRSSETLEEMRSVARKGDTIEATGRHKDDRVLSMAFCTHYWADHIRRHLIANRKTREVEEQKRRLSFRDQVSMFNDHQLTMMFAQKRAGRAITVAQASRNSWRYGR